MQENGHVVLELLSFYCKVLILESENIEHDKKENLETEEEEYEKRIDILKWQQFDEFASDLNDVFQNFAINVYLTRLGFVPKQEQKILDEIYNPVLISLSHSKWEEVNKILNDAFSEYRKKTPNGYSTSVTHAVASVQAFLQILVNGKIGSGEISKLILQAQAKNLIPADVFTKEIFKTIESILMRERQETGDPHPKKAYATDKNARIVLNLAMVFFQHCIVN